MKPRLGTWRCSPRSQLSPLPRASVACISLLQLRSYTSAIPAAALHFGQSLHETHPHLLKAGERMGSPTPNGRDLLKISTVTPGITAQEYAQRRSRLAAKLPNNGIAILAAADVKYRSGAVFYDFHQDPNFFYLTGMAAL